MKDKLIWWLLPKICRYLVIQGCQHETKIARYYETMQTAARERFYEDNDVTLKAFLTNCFNKHKLPHEN